MLYLHLMKSKWSGLMYVLGKNFLINSLSTSDKTFRYLEIQLVE